MVSAAAAAADDPPPPEPPDPPDPVKPLSSSIFSSIPKPMSPLPSISTFKPLTAQTLDLESTASYDVPSGGIFVASLHLFPDVCSLLWAHQIYLFHDGGQAISGGGTASSLLGQDRLGSVTGSLQGVVLPPLSLGVISPDWEYTPALPETCSFRTTTKLVTPPMSSLLPLGLILPGQKPPLIWVAAYLLPTTAIYVTSSTLSLSQVVSSSPSDSPMWDLYCFREEFVELVLKVRVTRLCSIVCMPSCGSFTALVRFFVVVCCSSYTDLFEIYVAMLGITYLWLKTRPNSPVMVTLPWNPVLVDFHCHPLSVKELSLLPNTTLVYSVSIGSNLLELVLLVAEAKMSSIPRLTFDDANNSMSTLMEVVSIPFWKLILDHHGEDVFFPECVYEFVTLFEHWCCSYLLLFLAFQFIQPLC